MSRQINGALTAVFCLALLVFVLSLLMGREAASAAQPATRQPPPTVLTIVPLPTTVRPRATRTPIATATPATVPFSAFQTATSEGATAQAATVQAIVALTSTALRGSPLTATPSATSISATSVPPAAYYPPPSLYPPPAGATAATSAGNWLWWLVVAVPFLALALALWWLFMRRFPLYQGWGRPRRGSRKAGRDYERRRSFPF
jgi:hypothetical protein